VWHEIYGNNGVEIDRFEKVYRMLIEDTKKRLPNVKMMLLEPFVLEGSATKSHEGEPDRYQCFLEVYDYAKVVKKLAEEYGLVFVPLQEKFNEGAKANGVEYYLWDGVHPWFGGAKLIADEWWTAFEENIK
jgi:lysophospholipase L1-like esterase